MTKYDIKVLSDISAPNDEKKCVMTSHARHSYRGSAISDSLLFSLRFDVIQLSVLQFAAVEQC